MRDSGRPSPSVDALIDARIESKLAERQQAGGADPWVSQSDSPLGRKLHCKLVRTGALEGSKIGRQVLVRKSVLDRFIEAHKVAPAARSQSADDDGDTFFRSLGMADPRTLRRRTRESAALAVASK